MGLQSVLRSISGVEHGSEMMADQVTDPIIHFGKVPNLLSSAYAGPIMFRDTKASRLNTLFDMVNCKDV